MTWPFYCFYLSNRRLVVTQIRSGQYGVLNMLYHIRGPNYSLCVFHSIVCRYRDKIIPAHIKRRIGKNWNYEGKNLLICVQNFDLFFIQQPVIRQSGIT
jgi:hypothetical protein